VVRPEYDTGRRVAHLVAGRMLDYIEFEDGYAIVKMKPPACMINKTLADAAIRATYGVTVVGVKRARKDFDHAVPSTVVREGDTVIVSGDRRKVEMFAEMNLPA
jgi:trk/ktr system potassium uptake protein